MGCRQKVTFWWSFTGAFRIGRNELDGKAYIPNDQAGGYGRAGVWHSGCNYNSELRTRSEIINVEGGKNNAEAL